MNGTSYNLADTIVAQATAEGQAAIGIIRLSGPQAWRIACVLAPGLPAVPAERTAYVVDVRVSTAGNEPLVSTGVVTFWRAPRTYTGEDLAEIALHGNPRLLQLAIATCCQAGARQAAPGEFTYRAVVNGKLDLAQAEAVQALITAGSTRALALAASSLGGAASTAVAGWDERLVRLLAGIEVIHDYGAGDLDASLSGNDLDNPQHVAAAIERLVAEMQAAVQSAQATAAALQGPSVALCGPPNVGKSTLFNALLGRARAMTDAVPGTTRDYITESIEGAGGMRLTLVDTAGMRSSAPGVEAQGIARAQEWLTAADIVLWVEAADQQPAQIEPAAAIGQTLVRVVTRCDLLAAWPVAQVVDVAYVSGLTGQGIPELRQRLEELVYAGIAPGTVYYSARQAANIAQAASTLAAARKAIAQGMPLDAVAADLHAARGLLSAVCAFTDHRAVVNTVFSGFCVGK